MPLTHLLVDFENVQPDADEIRRVRDGHHQLVIFRGPGQKKYAADVVEAWQPLGDRLHFIHCTKAGRNALDMHIAFQLGRLVQQHAGAPARCVIVSRDTDYDPLLLYVRALGIDARRVPSLRAALGDAPKSEGKKAQVKDTAKKNAGKGEKKEGAKAGAKTAARTAAKTVAKTDGDRARGEGKASKKAALLAAPPLTQPKRKPIGTATKAVAKGAEKAEEKTAAQSATTQADRSAPKAAKRAKTTSSKAAVPASATTAPANAMPVAAPLIDLAIEQLRAHPKNRPAKRKALEKHFVSALRKKFDPAQAPALVDALVTRGAVALDGNRVSYTL